MIQFFRDYGKIESIVVKVTYWIYDIETYPEPMMKTISKHWSFTTLGLDGIE